MKTKSKVWLIMCFVGIAMLFLKQTEGLAGFIIGFSIIMLGFSLRDKDE